MSDKLLKQEFIERFGKIPKKLRPKFQIYKNTRVCVKYTKNWREIFINQEFLQEFNKYANEVLCNINKDEKFNDYELFQLFHAFRLKKIERGIPKPQKKFIIEKILNMATICGNNYFLVKWKRYPNLELLGSRNQYLFKMFLI